MRFLKALSLMILVSCSSNDTSESFQDSFPKDYRFSHVQLDEGTRGFGYNNSGFLAFNIENSRFADLADSIEVFLKSDEFSEEVLYDNGYRELSLVDETTLKIFHEDPDTIFTIDYYTIDDDIFILDDSFSPAIERHIVSVDSVNDVLFLPFVFTYYSLSGINPSTNAKSAPDLNLYDYSDSTLLKLYGNLNTGDTILVQYGRLEFARK